jgi:hypothetical protein
VCAYNIMSVRLVAAVSYQEIKLTSLAVVAGCLWKCDMSNKIGLLERGWAVDS